ncbi:hypothetical protein J2T57_001329 [Natronocella acetinitrilica]|uniref:Uncharacterized protein n=1 Tax=Natronocella acetinitrilica TaxID=414046 RepID=A0AAE3KFM6_9GAMM|nr:hypothetical protein [Natronocella acetinitrilica]MCP1674227.1 hypothetical protein [Natronocella acetinitrilica]
MKGVWKALRILSLILIALVMSIAGAAALASLTSLQVALIAVMNGAASGEPTDWGSLVRALAVLAAVAWAFSGARRHLRPALLAAAIGFGFIAALVDSGPMFATGERVVVKAWSLIGSPKAALRQGEMALAAGDAVQARTLLREAADGGATEALPLLAGLALRAGDLSRAHAHYRTYYHALPPTDRHARYREGVLRAEWRLLDPADAALYVDSRFSARDEVARRAAEQELAAAWLSVQSALFPLDGAAQRDAALAALEALGARGFPAAHDLRAVLLAADPVAAARERDAAARLRSTPPTR